MKILVTGANGFIGKNLCLKLISSKHEVLKYDLTNSEEELTTMINSCDFIMHLAGVNRPLTPNEFYDGNVNFTYKLLELVKKSERQIPLLFSSSIHALKDNDYGLSKQQAETLIFNHGKETGSPIFIYRLANAFGKWSKPNYNSVIATFCYNVANDIELEINDPDVVVPFVYIDDITDSFVKCIKKNGEEGFLSVEPVYHKPIGELASLVKSFKESRKNNFVVKMEDAFTKLLYSTYLSYLSTDDFAYPLTMNVDQRGSFTEFIKTEHTGQVSINVAKAGIVKGNHWHHTKNEKFLVVSGQGVIRFRKIGTSEIIVYTVSGNELVVVDIPCGYTHNIENVGTTDLVTVMWANEAFVAEAPDTFYEEV